MLALESVSRILYREFVAGKTWFDWLFLVFGILLQVLVYVWHPASPVMIVSGLSGVCAVVLCSQGRISSFFFGFVQVVTYAVITFNERLYAETAVNVFYFITMIYGVYVWIRHYGVDASTDANVVQVRRLSALNAVILFVLTFAVSAALALLLSAHTDDSQPWLDAFTTVPSFVAQVLMIVRFREHWWLWLVVDVLSVAMWVVAANWSMAALYAFWCLNCLYGFRNWVRNTAA